jgi:hypothetical protein
MVYQWLGIKTTGTIFQFGLKTSGNGFSRFGLKIGGYRFLGLRFKTDSYDLVIWASISPRQFLGLGLKTKRTTICLLRHKTDRRMKTAWITRRDLAAYFMRKQVRLEFPNLPQNWWRRNDLWYTLQNRFLHFDCVVRSSFYFLVGSDPIPRHV